MWWWYALWATGGILSGTAPTICVTHYQCIHWLIVTTLIIKDLVTWSAFNVITIVISYQDVDHLWSWLPPLSSLNLLIFSFNFNAKLPFANIWASFNCFFLALSNFMSGSIWFFKFQRTPVSPENICQFPTNFGLRAFWQSMSGFQPEA